MKFLKRLVKKLFRAVREPYTVAEVLAMAIDKGYYSPKIRLSPLVPCSPYMCISVNLMRVDGLITIQEVVAVREHIRRWMSMFPNHTQDAVFLYEVLGDPTKPDFDLGQFVKNKGIPFYRARIRELEDRANGLSV